MTPYADKHGNSGVTAYDLFADAIHVRFRSGDVYRYSHVTPGRKHVAAMKRCAKAGEGLATYISREVQDRYERKL